MGMIDPDFFSVVFLLRCPYCGDKLERFEVGDKHMAYRHNDAGRTWCHQSNMWFGKFYTHISNVGFIYEGIRGFFEVERRMP